MTSPAPLPLLRQITCPHCWRTFHPEDVLWIAAHSDLIGDPRLGPDQPQRFLPTRFTVDGNALDARGFPCHGLACPHCHLGTPRPLLEMEPLFISILGTPACGKSYYLASLTWQLRKALPQFGLSFIDVEPLINQNLTDHEEALFLNPRPMSVQLLTSLIGKTKLQGEMYDAVSYGAQAVVYPRPYLFSLQLTPNHHKTAQATTLGRVVCLYDNAGEHFQPGRETTAAPVTQHLGRAELLLYLFDPTQDARFQTWLTKGAVERTSRQELILLEAAARIRRHLGLATAARSDRPLVVVLTKADAWMDKLSQRDWSEPWKSGKGVCGLDAERIEQTSAELRTLLRVTCPDLIQAAEGLATEVLYVPVSALGYAPLSTPNGPVVRPVDVKPIWVTAPVLYGLYRWLNRLVPGLRRKGDPAPSPPMSQRTSRPAATELS
jgi:hypothetical protein